MWWAFWLRPLTLFVLDEHPVLAHLDVWGVGDSKGSPDSDIHLPELCLPDARRQEGFSVEGAGDSPPSARAAQLPTLNGALTWVLSGHSPCPTVPAFLSRCLSNGDDLETFIASSGCRPGTG